MMEYGETCIPGRMDNLPTILAVADVKLYCDESHGYPYRSFELFFIITVNMNIFPSFCFSCLKFGAPRAPKFSLLTNTNNTFQAS